MFLSSPVTFDCPPPGCEEHIVCFTCVYAYLGSGLASLNTSDWTGGGAERQLSSLQDYLGRPGFIGIKLV